MVKKIKQILKRPFVTGMDLELAESQHKAKVALLEGQVAIARAEATLWRSRALYSSPLDGKTIMLTTPARDNVRSGN